jgi:predicted RNA-binding protein YlxR (DUF448 family)
MTSFPKKEVVRFVLEEGRPVIDQAGKKNGRGFYLCRSLECFDRAVKRKKIASDLRDEFERQLNSVEVTE